MIIGSWPMNQAGTWNSARIGEVSNTAASTIESTERPTTHLSTRAIR